MTKQECVKCKKKKDTTRIDEKYCAECEPQPIYLKETKEKKIEKVGGIVIS